MVRTLSADRQARSEHFADPSISIQNRFPSSGCADRFDHKVFWRVDRRNIFQHGDVVAMAFQIHRAQSVRQTVRDTGFQYAVFLNILKAVQMVLCIQLLMTAGNAEDPGDFMVQRKRQRLVRSRIASMQRKQQVVSGVRLISGDIGLDKFHIGIAQFVRDTLRLRNHAGVTVQSRKITGLSQYFLDIKIKRKRQVGFDRFDYIFESYRFGFFRSFRGFRWLPAAPQPGRA